MLSAGVGEKNCVGVERHTVTHKKEPWGYRNLASHPGATHFVISHPQVSASCLCIRNTFANLAEREQDDNRGAHGTHLVSRNLGKWMVVSGYKSLEECREGWLLPAKGPPRCFYRRGVLMAFCEGSVYFNLSCGKRSPLGK